MPTAEVLNVEGDKVILSTVLDITKRKKAEQELARLNDELEVRVAQRTEELAQRAAQLRALAGELTTAEQRERRRLARILHDHLQQLLVAAKFRIAMLGRSGAESVRRAAQDIQELLDQSISASRSLTAELSPPVLHEAGLNAGLQWLTQRMLEQHNLLIDLDTKEVGSLPDDLKILLFESVRELLFNIVKHAHTRSASLKVRRSDGRLEVIVSDPGSGFARRHCRESFKRVRDSGCSASAKD